MTTDPPARSTSKPARLAELVIPAVIALAFGFVAVIGAVNSFDTVQKKALEEDFSPALAWTLPAGIDGMIVALTAGGLWRAYRRRPIGWVRPVVWVLVAGTVTLNVAAAEGFWGIVAHGVLPALYVIAVEFGERVVRDLAELRTGAADTDDRIPAGRWIYAPWPTLRMHRHMKVWQITSYNAALAMEAERMLNRMLDRYQRLEDAPARKRQLLRVLCHRAGIDPAEIPGLGNGIAHRFSAPATTAELHRDNHTDDTPPAPVLAGPARVGEPLELEEHGSTVVALDRTGTDDQPAAGPNGNRAHAAAATAVQARMPARATTPPAPVAAPLVTATSAHLDESTARQLVDQGVLGQRELDAMLDVADALIKLETETGRTPTGAALGRHLGLDESTGRRRLARYQQIRALITTD